MRARALHRFCPEQVQQDAEARIEEVRRAAEAAALERESAMQRSGDEDSDWEPDAPGLPAIGRAATPSTASSKSTGRVHTSRPTLHDAEVAPETAASKAAARTQKQKPLEARQAEQKEELVKVRCARWNVFTVISTVEIFRRGDSIFEQRFSLPRRCN